VEGQRFLALSEVEGSPANKDHGATCPPLRRLARSMYSSFSSRDPFASSSSKPANRIRHSRAADLRFLDRRVLIAPPQDLERGVRGFSPIPFHGGRGTVQSCHPCMSKMGWRSDPALIVTSHPNVADTTSRTRVEKKRWESALETWHRSTLARRPHPVPSPRATVTASPNSPHRQEGLRAPNAPTDVIACSSYRAQTPPDQPSSEAQRPLQPTSVRPPDEPSRRAIPSALPTSRPKCHSHNATHPQADHATPPAHDLSRERRTIFPTVPHSS